MVEVKSRVLNFIAILSSCCPPSMLPYNINKYWFCSSIGHRQRLHVGKCVRFVFITYATNTLDLRQYDQDSDSNYPTNQSLSRAFRSIE